MAERLLREPVRYPATTRTYRKLDERIWARFPALIAVSGAAILTLSPGSRIRRALVKYWAIR